MAVTLDELEVTDPADAWMRAGFSVDSEDVCRVGGVRIRLVGRGRGTGIVGWSLRGLPPESTLDDLDGVPTTRSRPGGHIGPRSDPVTAAPATHANEVVGSPETASEGPSTLWGITYIVADIDATASFFGDRTLPVKEAVQPGRRISTLRHDEFGMSVRSAMISASR